MKKLILSVFMCLGFVPSVIAGEVCGDTQELDQLNVLVDEFKWADQTLCRTQSRCEQFVRFQDNPYNIDCGQRIKLKSHQITTFQGTLERSFYDGTIVRVRVTNTEDGCFLSEVKSTRATEPSDSLNLE